MGFESDPLLAMIRVPSFWVRLLTRFLMPMCDFHRAKIWSLYCPEIIRINCNFVIFDLNDIMAIWR